MIRVVAVITAIPGRREELLAAFRANVANVHGGKGMHRICGAYRRRDRRLVSDGLSDRTVWLFSNSWESPEALRAHIAAPHMKAYSEKTKDLVAKRTIHILSAID